MPNDDAEKMTELLATLPYCTGEWLSGSGGHRKHNPNCTNSAVWWHPNDSFAYCEDHIVERDKKYYWHRSEWFEKLADFMDEREKVISDLRKKSSIDATLSMEKQQKLSLLEELIEAAYERGYLECESAMATHEHQITGSVKKSKALLKGCREKVRTAFGLDPAAEATNQWIK
jgi:hypothetical protein